jgi:hypothetical protein
MYRGLKTRTIYARVNTWYIMHDHPSNGNPYHGYTNPYEWIHDKYGKVSHVNHGTSNTKKIK